MSPLSRAAVAVLAAVIGAGLAPLAPASAEEVRLDGIDAQVSPHTRQVVTVRHTHGWHARLGWWVRTGDGWERRLVAHDGRTGYGGLVKAHRRRQGTGTTPLGGFGLISAFGRHPDAGYDVAYRRIRPGDFWVQDNASRYYNRYRNKAQGGFRWWLPASRVDGSERLTDYPRQYEWAVVTSFNRRQVRHRGSGIFLHVNGRGATSGCVSGPRWFVRAVLRRLDASSRPRIAVGR